MILLNSFLRVEAEVSVNERTVSFLERLCDKLEAHFIEMEVKQKIDRRQGELRNLLVVCSDYEKQLAEMNDSLTRDQGRVEKKINAGAPEEIVIDDEGTKLNLLEELQNL